MFLLLDWRMVPLVYCLLTKCLSTGPAARGNASVEPPVVATHVVFNIRIIARHPRPASLFSCLLVSNFGSIFLRNVPLETNQGRLALLSCPLNAFTSDFSVAQLCFTAAVLRAKEFLPP